MILSIGLVGSTAIVTPASSFFGINKITIKNNDSYFDKIRMLDTPLSESEMDVLLKTDEYAWTSDTRLLMEFDQNLLGGNTGIDVADIQRMILYRAESSDPLLTLTTIDNNISPTAINYTDYTASDGKSYIYYLTLVDSTGRTSELFSSNIVTSSYDSFFLIDGTEGVVFRFNVDASSSQIIKNESFNVYTSNQSQYPLTSRGLQFFDTSTVNCMLGYIDSNGNYIDNIAYLDSLASTIRNKNVKLIKNRAGQIWSAQTNGLRYLADTRTNEHQHSISFNFTEISAVNGG